jgi:hypothetical protein
MAVVTKESFCFIMLFLDMDCHDDTGKDAEEDNDLGKR